MQAVRMLLLNLVAIGNQHNKWAYKKWITKLPLNILSIINKSIS